MSQTLLVVDDVPANLALLVDAAGAAGYRVLLAESGERALRLTTKVRPDLILLDWGMPGLDGFETCRRLRADPERREIPVIFLTARDDVLDKVAGLEAGAVDYVTKPIQPAEVLARVRVHLELRRLRVELQEEVRRREEAERSLRHSLDRAVIVAATDGAILFATVRAQRLLEQHFGPVADRLPSALEALVGTSALAPEFELKTAVASLRVRRFAEVGSGECVTLLLEEAVVPDARRLESLGLTPREAEVLFWIAQGKSNPEIAAILANTVGTVKKQVASILEKLAVENRMTAALKATALLEAKDA
ncbi:MAG: response regulator [Candidatus Didemnitutus sp.]|nr:response regulator [Candidatus Didemnitutus sp.]